MPCNGASQRDFADVPFYMRKALDYFCQLNNLEGRAFAGLISTSCANQHPGSHFS
jgi:hypothetical protein